MSESKKCLFCEKYELGDEVIWENAFFYAQFDMFPINSGHAEVIPKRHINSLLDLTRDEWLSLQTALSDVVEQIETTDFAAVYEAMLVDPINESSKKFCEQALEQALKGQWEASSEPDAYNYGVNDGEAAGRTIHHLHIHIIPRYEGDVENPRGGVRNIIPKKGNY